MPAASSAALMATTISLRDLRVPSGVDRIQVGEVGTQVQHEFSGSISRARDQLVQVRVLRHRVSHSVEFYS